MDPAIALRIDRAEARLSIAVAVAAASPRGNQVTPLAGGAAVLVRAGSPINKVIGVGFDGELDPDQLAEIEARWHGHGAAAQLGARGYRLLGFEHVERQGVALAYVRAILVLPPR